MAVYVNGVELNFVEHGYKFIFMKPYGSFKEQTMDQGAGGKLHIEFYDNGVQIRSRINGNDVTTVINRQIAIDKLNNKIYILEAVNEVKYNSDGSLEVL